MPAPFSVWGSCAASSGAKWRNGLMWMVAFLEVQLCNAIIPLHALDQSCHHGHTSHAYNLPVGTLVISTLAPFSLLRELLLSFVLCSIDASTCIWIRLTFRPGCRCTASPCHRAVPPLLKHGNSICMHHGLLSFAKPGTYEVQLLYRD